MEDHAEEVIIEDPSGKDHVFFNARLSREIGGTVFCGKIEAVGMSATSGERFFGLRYDDNDFEDLTEKQVVTECTFLEFPDEAAPQGTHTVLCDLRHLLTSGIMSDVVLRVHDQEVNVHKCILAARSPVFRQMFSCGMAEEATNTVVIEDVEFRVLQLFCEFVYTGAVGDSSIWEVAALVHDLAYVALKYDCKDLFQVCCQKLSDMVTAENVSEFLLLAIQAQPRGKLFLYRCLKIALLNMSEVQSTNGWKTLMEHKQIAPEVMSLILRTAYPPRAKRKRTSEDS